MAAMPPGMVEIHVHHVVLAFHINKVRYNQPKNCARLAIFSAKNNNGTNAKNIKNVNGETGHATNNNKPDKRDNKNAGVFFNAIFLNTKYKVRMFNEEDKS